jgi:hypothetical protein
MRTTLLVILWALPSFAGDIFFTNKVATFTNLQGVAFKHVTLVKGDLDGVIWRDTVSGGRICYTNLHPELLESWGISTNRIEIALDRAQHKAVADAKYRAAWAAEARVKLKEQSDEQEKLAAEKPAKALKAQQQSDLSAIQALQERINALDRELRHAQAMAVEDQKRGGTSYIKDTAVEQLNDLHEQLDNMVDRYSDKYGTIPKGVKTGVRWDYTR